MATLIQIAAAQKFAPPLLVVGQVDRRGAKLRSVNRRAVDYAHRAGMSLETVYPGALGSIRALAPPMGSPEAGAFVRATGLTQGEVYPSSLIAAGEGSPRRLWSWGWAAVGAFVGAALVGPGGLAFGVASGLLGGSR